MGVTVEICVDTIAGARAAAAGGATRIELCSGLGEGGVTSSVGLLRAVRSAVDLDVVVLIRARGGDFVYSPAECDAMRHDIDVARDAGAAGVAIGALRPTGELDLETIGAWVEHARPLVVTLHRAFDFVPDAFGAIDDLVALGVERVLSAGQAARAGDGVERLRELVSYAAARIAIIAAGGVRSANVAHILEVSGVREVHSSARTRRVVTAADAEIAARLGCDSSDIAATDEAEVRAIVAAVRRDA